MTPAQAGEVLYMLSKKIPFGRVSLRAHPPTKSFLFEWRGKAVGNELAADYHISGAAPESRWFRAGEYANHILGTWEMEFRR